ncbi:MAG: protein kinase [Gordonia sp. (in: high G+C Gram-positive bacteria)]|uniref:serine/threonine-protein kinase n=1 Tax=Gordonia sp. (in: high G+C Gram-positive bacteria) TaxID=84139 RepID=UPI003BB71DDF
MDLSPGSTFAGYRVVRQLGHGGMGQVYLVENPMLHRLEALKVLSTGAGAAADFTERFAREARTAAGLQHPSIITVHAYGVEGDDPWFTMSYLDGEDLSQAKLTDAEITEVAKQAASALDYAHHRGVIHRDIKPANIFITRDHNGQLATVTVLDFGIAKLANATGLTGTNMFIGTLAYSAPEIIEGEFPTGAADQYSLACALYQLLTGVPPFPADSHVALMRAHLDKVPPTISTHRPEFRAADSVFARALAKRPTERFASCTALATAVAVIGTPAPSAAELYAPTAQVSGRTHTNSGLVSRTRHAAPDPISQRRQRRSGAADVATPRPKPRSAPGGLPRPRPEPAAEKTVRRKPPTSQSASSERVSRASRESAEVQPPDTRIPRMKAESPPPEHVYRRKSGRSKLITFSTWVLLLLLVAATVVTALAMAGAF